MHRWTGAEGLQGGHFRRPVVTLGNFDGVHRGHGAVLAETLRIARDVDGDAVAVTFDVHPKAVVSGRAPALLTSPELRLRLLEEAGMAATVVLHFDEAMRAMEARTFLRDRLAGEMGIRGLVLGHDARFGLHREGDFALAREILEPLGVRVVTVPPVVALGEPVSSTALRRAVAEGDLDRVRAMAGRDWELLGTVVRGDGRGRTLGWPTANLDVGGVVRPPRGVWVGEARPDGEGVFPCLVNIGGRPTFHDGGAAVDTVEAWLDGFHGDLYDRTVRLTFLARLRDERRFDGIEGLRAQIAIDRDAMVEFFRRRGTRTADPGHVRPN